MQRFYVTFPLSPSLTLDDKEIFHQLTRVLRIKVGECIIFFQGDGIDSEYQIQEISKKSIQFHRVNERKISTEPKRVIHLYQALPNKIEKIEYIIEKGVEIGIHRFVFFRSERSQKLQISEMKEKRFLSIAKEALEQCGGTTFPIIEFSHNPPDFLGIGKNIMLDTLGGVQNLREVPRDEVLSLWVGPEGGWSENERNKMKEYGFISVRLGERILRTETAGVVTAFSLLHA